MADAPSISVPVDVFLRMSDRERFEWVDGRLVERRTSWLTSWLGARLTVSIGHFVHELRLGFVSGADNALILSSDPPAVRFASSSFTSHVRAPRGPSLEFDQDIAPDLVVELVPLDQPASELDLKVRQYLDAGVRIVWVVYPVTRSVVVIHPDGTQIRLAESASLDGEDVLPGFSLPVAAIFEGMPEVDPAASA